eukprot:4677143-Pleurochrysis_carterae.AAC.1
MNYCISSTAVANRRRRLPVDISPRRCERRHPSLGNAPLFQLVVDSSHSAVNTVGKNMSVNASVVAERVDALVARID